MDWSTIDWNALERLRNSFLEGTAGAADYWRTESDLASYDATFAQRIGWKWDYVLNELRRRGWLPAPGPLLDWGCGSGIAHRAFLDHFGASTVSTLRLCDRSSLAMRFAERRAREKFPNLTVERVSGSPAPTLLTDTTFLISHVLTELRPQEIEALADTAATATSVIWVEPGTYEASLTLIAIRERLRGRLNVIAPCTHQEQCGMLAPRNERHWCHHFAPPPPEVFTDRHWARFAQIAGVDLRSLPLSFLVLDRRPSPSLPAGSTRVIGRPRLYKPHASLLGCDASGVEEKRLSKRTHPDLYRELKRGDFDPLQVLRCEEQEILESVPLLPRG
jgi:ribosomal protein RSM22 (predicted rRNA methylase)